MTLDEKLVAFINEVQKIPQDTDQNRVGHLLDIMNEVGLSFTQFIVAEED